MRVQRTTGWRRYFTLTYWRIQWGCWLLGRAPLTIVETFTIDLPPEEQL